MPLCPLDRIPLWSAPHSERSRSQNALASMSLSCASESTRIETEECSESLVDKRRVLKERHNSCVAMIATLCSREGEVGLPRW